MNSDCKDIRYSIKVVMWSARELLLYLYRKSAVCPIIDVVSDDTFEYIPGGDTTWGGFNWKLNFRWYQAPKRENERRGGDRSIPMR